MTDPLIQPRLLSLPEAAAYLGVSRNTFLRHVKVADVRIGGRLLYDRAALDKWVVSNGGVDTAADDDGIIAERKRLREAINAS